MSQLGQKEEVRGNLAEEIETYDIVNFQQYELPSFQEFYREITKELAEVERARQQACVWDNRSKKTFVRTMDDPVGHDQLPSIEVPTIRLLKEDALFWEELSSAIEPGSPAESSPPSTLDHTDSEPKHQDTLILYPSENDVKGRAVQKPVYPVNIRVKALIGYTAKKEGELTFMLGQSIKQKTTSDAHGMATGWTRNRRTGRKRYGMFPVTLVEANRSKPKFRERILKALTG